jgi:spore maturation protein SpmA
MLNAIFVIIVVFSVLWAAWFGGMGAVTQAVLDSAKAAVELAIKLIGVMAFFLGLMQVAQDGGILRVIARAVGPVLRYIFPGVPKDHPAMSAMIMNIASNMLGLGNAATPFGIKAMTELQKLNARKDTTTNAMVVFLAINTSGLALLPTGVIGLRAAAGSENAAGIFFPTWFASGCATVVGITVALALSRLPSIRATEPPAVDPEAEPATEEPSVAAPEPTEAPAGRRRMSRRVLTWAFTALFVAGLVVYVVDKAPSTAALELFTDVASFWVIPGLILAIVLFGWSRGVKVYESLVEGGKEGFQVAVRIIPYLVAILVMVGMFRASGGMALLVNILDPVTSRIGFPVEAIPVALIRPFSGTGAFGIMTEVMSTHGPDSFIGYMVSTMTGATETTFYVLAVYFGAIGVKKTRHALPSCLMADVAGISAAVFIVNLLFG